MKQYRETSLYLTCALVVLSLLSPLPTLAALIYDNSDDNARILDYGSQGNPRVYSAGDPTSIIKSYIHYELKASNVPDDATCCDLDPKVCGKTSTCIGITQGNHPYCAAACISNDKLSSLEKRETEISIDATPRFVDSVWDKSEYVPTAQSVGRLYCAQFGAMMSHKNQVAFKINTILKGAYQSKQTSGGTGERPVGYIPENVDGINLVDTYTCLPETVRNLDEQVNWYEVYMKAKSDPCISKVETLDACKALSQVDERGFAQMSIQIKSKFLNISKTFDAVAYKSPHKLDLYMAREVLRFQTPLTLYQEMMAKLSKENRWLTQFDRTDPGAIPSKLSTSHTSVGSLSSYMSSAPKYTGASQREPARATSDAEPTGTLRFTTPPFLTSLLEDIGKHFTRTITFVNAPSQESLGYLTSLLPSYMLPSSETQKGINRSITTSSQDQRINITSVPGSIKVLAMPYSTYLSCTDKNSRADFSTPPEAYVSRFRPNSCSKPSKGFFSGDYACPVADEITSMAWLPKTPPSPPADYLQFYDWVAANYADDTHTDTNILPNPESVGCLVVYAQKFWPGSHFTKDYIDRTINFALDNGLNPAFLLSIWLEESHAGAATPKEFGCGDENTPGSGFEQQLQCLDHIKSYSGKPFGGSSGGFLCAFAGDCLENETQDTNPNFPAFLQYYNYLVMPE